MQKRAKKGSDPLEGLEGVPWIVNLTIFTFIKPDDDVSTVLYVGNDFHSILERITEILNQNISQECLQATYGSQPSKT